MDDQLELAIEIIQETTQAIMDYRFHLSQIERLEKELQTEVDTGLTAAYGIEATMPRAKGTNSDKVFREAKRRERKWKQLHRYRESVDQVDKALELLKDDRQMAVIENLLEGTRKHDIASQIGVSRRKYYEVERLAIKNMAKFMYQKKEF